MLKGKSIPYARSLDLAPGDTVLVITGKDRGKEGEVVRVLPARGKIVVKGVNVLKRHVKAGQAGQAGARAMQGGIVDFEAPLSYSNVMLVCPLCHKPTRVRRARLETGAKAFRCQRCDEVFERIRPGATS